MNKYLSLLFLSFMLFAGCREDPYRTHLNRISEDIIMMAPLYYTKDPGLPSPAINKEGRELVMLKLTGDKYTWIDATVENGETFDYKNRLYGKGKQLMADSADFPSLARKGLHSEKELRNTKIITGRSVSQITIDGRPWGSSGVGFMSDDETILSVILADNRCAKSLGLTHPDLARPLFHLWNMSREFEDCNIDTATGEKLQIEAVMYNGKEIFLEVNGSRGWQESIFNDEILGSGHIEISREPDMSELDFLEKRYAYLPADEYQQLKNELFNINTGEMVYFYINRYGFYEGHTEYRVDPLTVALLFGIRTIEDVHRSCGGDLYKYYNTSFTENPY
ncbi:MAG: hypothetical protein V2I34_08005 [Bacteroidales bacterium]|jgi:hypothetical protein|nr:hypothetical protein [Bacteroidales bacterium]